MLLVSVELDEIMALSDRIAVMYEGRIVATIDADKVTREELGLLMAGARPGEVRQGSRPALPDQDQRGEASVG